MSNKKNNSKKVTVSKSRNTHYIALIGILIITYVVFSPSLNNSFTNWDDNIYIAENSLIKSISVDNIKTIFKTESVVSLNYHPLTILSFAIDYKLSGYNPHTFHLTNLLIHLLNTALVFWLFYLLSTKRLIVASIVALFFGIHPMHVESVTWVAERKDVLYTFFFLLSCIMYLKYLATEKNRLLLYFLVIALFVLSCLSKAMAVILPMVFLLIDFYTTRKIDKKAIIEKLPLFVISICFGWLTLHIQSQGAIAKFEVFTLFQRFAFASYGLISYIYKFFLPIHLSCFYPYPFTVNDGLPIIFYLAPVIVLTLFILAFVSLKKTRLLLFGFLFYFFTIVLVLQFVSVGQAIMADRYSYIPYLGILFPIAVGCDWLYSQHSKAMKMYKQLVFLLIVSVSIAFSYLTYQRTQVWKNGDTLWTDAIKNYPHNETFRNRGSYLVNKAAYDLGAKTIGENEYDRALEDFNNSIKINATNPKVFINRANIYGLKARFEESLKDYDSAIALDSSDSQSFFNRGVTYGYMKNYEKSVENYTRAIKLQPNFPKAQFNKANDLINLQKYEEAITELNKLIEINNSDANYYLYRGFAYLRLSKMNEALSDHNASLQLNPNNSNTLFNRAIIYQSLGKYNEALNDALNAQKLGYNVEASFIQNLRAKL